MKPYAGLVAATFAVLLAGCGGGSSTVATSTPSAATTSVQVNLGDAPAAGGGIDHPHGAVLQGRDEVPRLGSQVVDRPGQVGDGGVIVQTPCRLDVNQLDQCGPPFPLFRP